MISEAIARYPWLWTLAWQSTVCLATGLVGSHLLRRRAVRAHQILLLGLIAAALIPTVSQVVKRNGWGLFEAERTVPRQEQSLPAAQIDPVATAPQTIGDAVVSPRAVENTVVASAPVAERFDSTGIILLLWLAASAALLLRLASQLVLGRRIVRRSEVVAEPRITDLIEAAREELAIQAEVAVRSGSHVRSPVIWCWGRRPILLIPDNSCGRDDGLDWASVICHELAHWKRRDHLSGLFVELMVCVMPWQPLTWWTRRRLVALSEEACDDWVIASGQRATRYARTLLSLLPQDQTALIPSVVPSRKGLSGRIHRILHDACGNPSLGPRWAVASISLAVCIVLGVALAQTRPASSESQPQTDATITASEEPAVPEGKIILRLVDSSGQPVAGARAGAYMQMHDASVLGGKLDWRSASAGVSDPNGWIVLNATGVFVSNRGKEMLYILHENRGIGAIHEVARETPAGHFPAVVLTPVCRVHGTLASTGLADVAMPLRWAHLYVYSQHYPVLECHFEQDKHSFDFPLPAGTYTITPYGSGGKEDPFHVSVSTESKALPLTIPEGQRDLDLGVIDLAPTKLATLIGRPAPEIGPVKAWKHGPGAGLAQLKGQIVWLHFGGEHPSASRDLPELAKLHETFAGKGLAIIAIYNCDSLEQLEQRWAEANERFGGVRDVPFRIAIDGGKPTVYPGTDRERLGATYGRYDITAYPTNVLIDHTGNIVGQPNLSYAREIISQRLGVREAAMQPDWQRRFYEVYRLADNEVLKRIAPPFIPERMEYCNSERKRPRAPDRITFHWDGQLRNWGMAFGDFATLGSILNGVLQLKSHEYDGPKSLLDIELPGDWIIRDEASQEAKLRALEQLVAGELGHRIRFERHSVEREAIIATGEFRFHPSVGTYENTSVHLYASGTDPDERAGGGTADSLHEFLQTLGNRVNMPVIDQTEASVQGRIPYRHHRSSYLGEIPDEQERAKQLGLILAHLTEQTELQFEIRIEPVPVWHVVEETGR